MKPKWEKPELIILVRALANDSINMANTSCKGEGPGKLDPNRSGTACMFERGKKTGQMCSIINLS